jgi:hypothetical protein
MILGGEDLSELFGLDIAASAAKNPAFYARAGHSKARKSKAPKQENNAAREDGTVFSEGWSS